MDKLSEHGLTEEGVCSKCFYTPDKCTCQDNVKGVYLLIDKGLHEHIRILNSKGYKTRFCCESHNKNDQIYILFNNCFDVKNEMKDVPKGFWLYSSSPKIVYTYDKKLKDCDFERVKKKQLDILLEWAKELPETKRLKETKKFAKANGYDYRMFI